MKVLSNILLEIVFLENQKLDALNEFNNQSSKVLFRSDRLIMIITTGLLLTDHLEFSISKDD